MTEELSPVYDNVSIEEWTIKELTAKYPKLITDEKTKSI